MKKKLFLFFLFLTLFAGVTYSALWHVWARELSRQIIFLQTGLGAQGVQINGEFTPVTGFPAAPVAGFSGSLRRGYEVWHIPAVTVRGYMLPGTNVQIDLPQGLRADIAGMDDFLTLVDELHMNIRLPAPLPRSLTVADLRLWQAADAPVQLRHLILRKGMMRIDGKGTLKLDDDLQPVIAMPAEIRGHMDFLMGLQARRIIDGKQALLVGAAMSGLSKPNEEGENVLSVNLTVADRALYVGPFRLIDVPPVIWSE